MATSSKIHLTPATAGVFHVDNITEESARVASELLQENHEKHHMYFNDEGFHNHIAHHLLTLFSLGASAEQLRTAYSRNASYQNAQQPIDSTIVETLSDDFTFRSCLGKDQYYHSFLAFYEEELEKKGWEKTLVEHVFTEPTQDGGRAQELFVRLYAGFLHPLIHLGFGISFKQPAIIAEALAQAATHIDHLSAFLLSPPSNSKDSPSAFDLLSLAQRSEALCNSAEWTDRNKLYDGVLTRALQDMISICSQYHVPLNAASLNKAAAEMVSLDGYMTLTALRPDKIPKVDFFYMHCLNCSIFFCAFDSLPDGALSMEDKARLLEAKVRTDLALYVSRRCPSLSVSELESYAAESAAGDGHSVGWNDIFDAVKNFQEDDGHIAKLIRAVANAAEFCAPYEEAEQWPLRGQNWLRAGKMVIDSVKLPGGHWIRGAGFEEAWKDVPGREKRDISTAA